MFRRTRRLTPRFAIVAALFPVLITLGACASHTDVFHDQNMDFGAVQTVAVMPFANYSRESAASERVRDVFINKLLSTGVLYVLPVGEVARAVTRAEVQTPATPSPEETVKKAALL